MKRSIAFIITIFMLATLSLTAFASSAYIVDEADVLSDSEESELASLIMSFIETYGVDLTYITTTDTGGMIVGEYGAYHESVDLGTNGVVFAIDVANRDYATETRGSAREALTDQALDLIDENVVPYLSNEDYFGAFEAHIETMDTVFAAAASGELFVGEEEGGSLLVPVIIAVVGGAVISFGVTGSMVVKMNTARKQREAASYIRPGSFNIFQSYDRFLHEHTSREEKKKEKDDKPTHNEGGKRSGSY